MTRDEKIGRLIDDIVSCADVSDGGQDDARAYCEELVATLSTPAPHDCEAWRLEGMGCARCNRAPVAAPPADLVAIVREYQRLCRKRDNAHANGKPATATDAEFELKGIHYGLLAFPLPEVPK